MSQKEQLIKELTRDKREEQDEQKKILDVLRKTRVTRGGVGAPLEVPRHLRAGIIVTDR